jgi:guanylate kinase
MITNPHENLTDLGCLFIVSAPSGAGKTSLVRNLVNTLDNIQVSISHTTRQKRPAEVHTVDYFFVDETEFNAMIARKEFLEFAQVFGALYGTSLAQINQCLQQGIDVVLDIDWQGALQIKKIFSTAVGIFILPPSLEALQQRLFDRQQDCDTVIASRMRRARDEIQHYMAFDYLIVNDDFTIAAQELITIVSAERLRLSRQSARHKKLLSLLLA